MKNETMGDKTLGGEKKEIFCLSRRREKKNDWCKEQKNQKDRITYVGKQGERGETKISAGQTKL